MALVVGTVSNVTGKGFGFIKTDESEKDVFYHESTLPEGLRLKVGDKVQFEIEQTEKGPNAKNITLVEE